MPKILTVVERAYHGTLEEQDDTILWMTAALQKAGGDLSLLLRGNAVNYAVNGQDASGVVIGGLPLKPPTIDRDVQEFVQKGVPVYAVGEDMESRGIDKTSLVKGVQVIAQKDVAKLWDAHQAVWHW